MHDPTPRLPPVVITLPATIDVTNADDVTARIRDAFKPGVTVVVADMTATTFCDSRGVHQLWRTRDHADAAGAELRLVIPPDGPLKRIVELTGLEREVTVYPTVSQAAADPASSISPPS